MLKVYAVISIDEQTGDTMIEWHQKKQNALNDFLAKSAYTNPSCLFLVKNLNGSVQVLTTEN